HPSTTLSYPLSLHDALPIYLLTPDPSGAPSQPAFSDVSSETVSIVWRSSARATLPINSTDWDQARSISPLSGFLYQAASQSLLRSEEHTSELQSRSDLVCRL